MAASVLAMMTLAPQLHSLVYALPTTWGLGLIVGSALRLYRVHVFSWFTGHRLDVRPCSDPSPSSRHWSSSLKPTKARPSIFFGGPLAMAAAAVLVALAASRTAAMPKWTRPMQMLGTVSYAAYLWNYVVILWLNGGSTADLPPLVAVSAILLTLLIAVISWHTVERLGRMARARFDKHYPDKSYPAQPHAAQPRAVGTAPARQASPVPGRATPAASVSSQQAGRACPRAWNGAAPV